MTDTTQPLDGSPPTPPKDPKRAATRRANALIQLSGMGVFIYEAVIRTWDGTKDVRTNVLAICALAIMGSEAAKDLMLRLFDRTLGGGSDP